jgi:hypothetical protein
MRYILTPFNEFLPEYYFHIYNGEMQRLMDCPAGIEPSIQGILGLLEEKGSLACKLKSGSLGRGFHKLACSGQDYQVDNLPSSREEVEGLFSTWLQTGQEERIITEYIQAHHGLQNIYPHAPASLRLNVIKEKGQAARMIFGVLSFPTQATGILANQQDGWVICMVDVQTGELAEGRTSQNGSIAPCACHPDTHVPMAGILPNWSLVAEKIPEICSYLPQLCYLGFDIIVTGQGFKITEINSHPYINLLQLEHPFLKDEVVKGFFNQLLGEKKGGGR